MTKFQDSASRPGRLLRVLALTSVLALGVTACSGGSESEDATSSASAQDEKKAAAALTDGLEAHTAGDLTAAAAKYEEVLKFDATNKFALYNLALIDESDGNYGLAEEKYRAALKTDPAYEPALFNLAILRTDNDPTEAIKLYEAAVKADKKDAAAWLNLGLLQRERGMEAAGDENVARALKLNPTLKDPDEAASGSGVTAP